MNTTELIAAIHSGALVTPYAAALRLGQPLQSVLNAIRTERLPSIQHPLYSGRVLVRLVDVSTWAEKKHPTQGKRTDLVKRRKNATRRKSLRGKAGATEAEDSGKNSAPKPDIDVD